MTCAEKEFVEVFSLHGYMMHNKTMNAPKRQDCAKKQRWRKSLCSAPGRVVEGVTEERELNPGVI